MWACLLPRGSSNDRLLAGDVTDSGTGTRESGGNGGVDEDIPLVCLRN